jgi:D-alanyl-D-alanine carboxypeptidase
MTGQINHSCTAGDSYAGPPKISAPEGLWKLPFDLNSKDRLDPGLAAAFEHTLDTIATKVPGVSVVVAIPGEGTWTGARGVARTSPRMELPDVPKFQIASITKVYTAIAIMQLVEEGKISLQSPVSLWYPELPNAEIITIDQLLRHTSGIPSFNAIETDDKTYIPPDSAIALAAKSDNLFCPGTNWSYSNTGYLILGRILEKVEKTPLDSVFARRVYNPLGLKHTVLRQRGDTINGLVSGHFKGVPDSIDYATPFAAGSIVSTAFEVTQFWHAVLSGKLISNEAVRSLFSELSPMVNVADASYGRGVMLYNGAQGPGMMLGHSGGVAGFTSVVAYMVQDQAYICVLFNDKQYAAEAGLWSLVRTLRDFRTKKQARVE